MRVLRAWIYCGTVVWYCANAFLRWTMRCLASSASRWFLPRYLRTPHMLSATAPRMRRATQNQFRPSVSQWNDPPVDGGVGTMLPVPGPYPVPGPMAGGRNGEPGADMAGMLTVPRLGENVPSCVPGESSQLSRDS